LIPRFDGASLSPESKDALWARFFTGAPPRRRRSVERYSIVQESLRALGGVADWLLSEEIEDCLVADFAFAEPIIRDRLRRAETKTGGATSVSGTVRALRRVASRGAGEISRTDG
jgi:hypothetical protein